MITLKPMCGRYNILPDAQAWADVGAVLGELLGSQLRAQAPRYNIAPTQKVPIIVAAAEGGEPRLIEARWGFVPPWWRQPALPTLTSNVRSETAASKPMWRSAWRGQRCLIPASSWYEWFVLDSGQKKPPKVPHLLARADGKHILFAGLWSLYQAFPDTETVATCSIVTIPSAPQIAEIHERTPVVLNPAHWLDWLNPALTDANAVQRMVREGAVEHFRMHTLDARVGNARFQGPDCLLEQDWPAMQAQGRAVLSKAQLQWLRTAPAPSLQAELPARLAAAEPPAPAERRLWLRELRDRDDADALAELLAEIQATLKPLAAAPRIAMQGSLF